MENETTQLTSLGLAPAILVRLERIAQARALELQVVLTEAIEQYLDHVELRAAWIQDGTDALSHYRETGLHLTGEEVDEWLRRLQEGEDVDPPPCHV